MAKEQQKKAPSAKPTAKKPAPAKKPAGAQKKQTAPEKESAAKRPLHLYVVPAVFSILAVLLLVFFIFSGDRGIIGNWITRVFSYLFGGAIWAIPLLLVLAAVFWRRDWENGDLVAKGFFNGIVFLSFDTLLYDIVACWAKETLLSGAEIWAGKAGAVGGGVVGNFLGSGMVKLIGKIATPILLILLLILFGIFLFGITPAEALIAIRRAYRKQKNEAAARAAAAEDAIREEEEEDRESYPAHPYTVKKSAPAGHLRHPDGQEERKKKEKTKFSPDVAIGDCDESAPDDDFDESGVHTLRDGAQIPLRRNPTVEDEPLPVVGTEEEAGRLLDGEDAIAAELETLLRDELSNAPDTDEKRDPLAEILAEDGAEPLPDTERERFGDEEPEPESKQYILPPLTLLAADRHKQQNDFSEEKANAEKLVETLRSFKVETHVEDISRGPTVTRYELAPEKGVRVRAIANLADDIALNLAAEGVRIEAPIPGKAAVGIEVPKKNRETVYLRTLFDTDEFCNSKYTLTAALGKDVGGNPVYMDIAKMPHLLIAGTTGSGKSVCMNSLILSLLYKYSPDDVKMIMIDPKKVEFNIYNGLPHLIIPVVSQAKKAAGALSWAVIEMERRYELIEDVGVRDLKGYNAVTANDPDREYLPLLVIFIDELADLMMTAPSEVEESICRIAQKGRAAGLHLIIGTQRPSVDVITGLIKANVPSRIAFTVSSQVDSRTIIDIGGAEKLIGRGDMLFAPIGVTKPYRIQGAFVSDAEVEAVTDFIKENAGSIRYDDDVIKDIEKEAELCGVKKGKSGGISLESEDDGESDPMLEAAIDLAVESGKISTSLIQRRLSLGYGRSAKLIDKMEQMGVVSPPDGQKPRTVLISAADWAEQKMQRDTSV